ncbi:11134_t:CDS:1, partial [Acaulospora colombiana]
NFFIQVRQHLTGKEEEKSHQSLQIPVNIQRSISDLAITLAKLETEHPNTYPENWLKEIQGSIK